jgi:uncharacterized RDD family membrane protein YckC
MMNHDVARLDVADLSPEQREMLTMRLRGLGVFHQFERNVLTAPAARQVELTREVAWIRANTESNDPERETPHPFLARLPDGAPLASRSARSLARFCDSLALNLVHVVFVILADLPSWTGLIAIAINEIVLVRWRGQTVGKMAASIKVRPVAGGRLRWAQKLLRAVLLDLSVIVTIFGASSAVVTLLAVLQLGLIIPIFWDPLRQGVHDRLAGTAVIATRVRQLNLEGWGRKY